MIRFFRRWLVRKSDKNLLDFPKYRKHGAYHWQAIESDDVYRDLVEFVCSIPLTTSRILDLGCGDGVYAGSLAKHGHSVVGIDGDFDAVYYAKKQLQNHQNLDVEILHLSISEILNATTFHDQFDLVVAMDVIEHLPDPRELLHAMQISCKAQGRICVGTPRFRSEELVSPHHVKEYKEPDFQALLEEFASPLEIHSLRARREKGLVVDGGYLCGVGTPLPK